MAHKIQRWIERVEEVFDSQSEVPPLSASDTKAILNQIQQQVKAKASTAGDLKLCSKGILQLWRIPHILDVDSLLLLVNVVDSLIFGLLSKVTAGKGENRQELQEVGILLDLVLGGCSKEKSGAVLKGCLDTLGGAIINTNLPVWLRTICIKGFNSLLLKAKKGKNLVWEKLNMKVEALFSLILTCGIYDTQAAVVELIFRILPKVEHQKTAEALIADDKALQLFLKIGGSNFEATCRKFLNQLNLSLGLQCKVFSFPVLACTLEGRSVVKPDAEDFWVDFNMGKEERGLAFYGVEEEGTTEQWQLEVISQEDVLEVNVSIPTPKCMLISLSRSGVIELSMDCIYFDQVLQILRHLFGSRLKETNVSRQEAATCSTPKRTLLLSEEGTRQTETEELPENTSIPPSEEEEGDQESLPCAQAPQEQVEKEGRPSEQTNCWKTREEIESKGKSMVSVSTPRGKVGGGAKSYSPVVMIGEARVDFNAKEGGNVGSENSRKVVESSTSALVEENRDQIDATPEMVGGPGVREDVSMTRSGGRKRAVRKVSESSRQKMQERSKPTNLDFQDEAAAVTHEKAKLDSSRGLVVNNKSSSGDEGSTSRGRKGKAVYGLKKMLGKVPRALGFGKNTSRRVSVSPSLGDISEVSAIGLQKRRALSALGAGGEKRRKLALNSEKAANHPEKNSNSLTIIRTVSCGRVEVRPSVCEAETQSRLEARVSSLKKGKATDQKVGVDCQDDVQGDCEEEMMAEVDSQEQIEVDSGSKNKSSRTSQSCRSLDGGDEEQEYVEERRQQGEKGSATRSAGGDSLQDASVRLIQGMSEQEAAGLSFLRLANPLIGVLVRASTNLRDSEQLKEGWMAVKKALAQQDDD